MRKKPLADRFDTLYEKIEHYVWSHCKRDATRLVDDKILSPLLYIGSVETQEQIAKGIFQKDVI